MKWIINKIIILILVIASVFALNHYFLGYDFIALLNKFVPIPNNNSSVSLDSQAISLTLIEPRQYQSIKISDKFRLELSQPYIGDLEVSLLSLDSTKKDKVVQKTYDLGLQRFNKGFIEINTKDYLAGQYKFVLKNSDKIVAESFVFSLVNEVQKLEFINPVSMSLMPKNDGVIRWIFTPDIYFVNIYLENDSERFIIAQNIPNTGAFDWNFTDSFNRDIASGEYVLLIEDNFTNSILNKVRFIVK
ncbi:MAG: hypothetical protein RLZZ223_491 [Candidatus Parcubacteria bacterium]